MRHHFKTAALLGVLVLDACSTRAIMPPRASTSAHQDHYDLYLYFGDVAGDFRKGFMLTNPHSFDGMEACIAEKQKQEAKNPPVPFADYKHPWRGYKCGREGGEPPGP